MIRTAVVIATLIFAAMTGTARAAENLITDKRIMFEPGSPAIFATPPVLFQVQGGMPAAESILLITIDGRIFWRGREVETDDEFRAAMIGLVEDMAVAAGGVRRCKPGGAGGEK